MKKILSILVILMVTGTLVFAGGGGQDRAAGGVPTVNVSVFDRGTDGGRSDPTNNNYTQWIQERVLRELNINIVFTAIPRAAETTMLNNMMAAGNPPDICKTYDQALITNFRDLGGLFDMAPHMSLMPDLDAFLGEDPMLPGRRLIQRSRDPQTGQIFSIPGRRMNQARINTFIRKDWLDILGLPLPNTTMEFYNAMVAFRDRNPGRVDRVLPIVSGRNIQWHLGNLFESFIDPNISMRDEWVNTVVDRRFLLPGYKEGVRFANRMYNEGLIDRDFPLFASDVEPIARIMAGNAGSYQANFDQVFRDSPGALQNLQANIPSAELVAIDPFRHPSGGRTIKYLYDAAGVYLFIPRSSRVPQEAMRYMNWLGIREVNNFLQLGPEGIAWDMVDGVPLVKPAPGLWIHNSPQNIDYTLPVNGLDLGDEALTMRGLANSYTVHPQLIVDAYFLSIRDARPLPVIPVTLTAAGPYQQTLIDMGEELMAQAIAAPAAQFDRVWDDGIRAWLAAGAETIRQERAQRFIQP